MAYIQKEWTMIFFIIEIRTAQVWKETDKDKEVSVHTRRTRKEQKNM